jgi:hypothetical protein
LRLCLKAKQKQKTTKNEIGKRLAKLAKKSPKSKLKFIKLQLKKRDIPQIALNSRGTLGNILKILCSSVKM